MKISKFFRYLERDKTFSMINICGLATGLTAILYISLYIWQETHYDNFHKDIDNLYRVSIAYIQNGNELGAFPTFVDPLAPAMKAEIPEIEAATRISSARSHNVSFDDQALNVEHVCFADTGFLEMFNFPLLVGNMTTALTAPYSIVITDKLAEKFFDRDDPMGKLLKLDGNDLYTVTGVVKTPPANTQFKFDALVSFSTLYRLPNVYMGWNGGNQYIALARLNSHASVDAVTEKTNQILYENLGAVAAIHGFEIIGSLQAIRDVHLHYDSGSETLRTNLSIFSAVAFLILIVAGINFVNMTAARSLRRIKEAGVRKILGANRSNLVMLFLGESLLVCFVAFMLAMLFFKLFEGIYIRLAGVTIGETVSSGGIIFGGVIALAALIGIIAGSYPAIRLSSLPLVDAAKGGGKQKNNKYRMQNILIVLQFAISVCLIVCTLVVSNQLSFIKSKDTGVDREGIINLSIRGNEHHELLKSRLEILPEVVAVSASNDMPVYGFSGNGYMPEGMENVMMINLLSTDEHFLDVYGIKLKEGRFFRDGEADLMTLVINESLAKILGWDGDALGKYISRGGRHEVIGVVHDFNYEPLHNEIAPLIIANRSDDDDFGTLSIKYNTGNTAALIGKINDVWMEVCPEMVFDYGFFDDACISVYQTEQRFQLLFFSFAFIAIVLAVLGMLTLMAYTIEQRRKEISIRKVMGASIFDVLQLLLRKTALQILIANIIACPVAWWFAQKWLENFAFRIQIGWTTFVLALFISAFIALAAIAYQTIKAATENPVKNLVAE